MKNLISSVQNPKIKALKALEKARERKALARFVIEGVKELTLAVTSNYRIETIFYCPDLIAESAVREIIADDEIAIPVTREVFEKLAYRESTGGVIAVAEQKMHQLESIHPGKLPLFVVVESVEKPGNLGALLRTADAAGVDALIVCDPLTDFYNPNVIRSSVGCVFTNQIASATSEETIHWLRTKKINIVCTSLEAAIPYTSVNFKVPTAIVLGTEASGLSEIWTNASDKNIIIPMWGKIDSMNVSNAAAVVIFEAIRQRTVT